MNQGWRRSVVTMLAVPLLAAPSAYGVYRYLAPESGSIAAASAAIGFELLYLGVNMLTLRTAELRAYARRVALAAVVTAVTFNALAHYAAKVPQAFSGASFALLPALLALITSLPLAGLAYAVSVLLHRLSEPVDALPTEAHAAQDAGHALANARITADVSPALLGSGMSSSASAIEVSERTCPRCHGPISQQQAAAAIRWGARWKGCQQCGPLRGAAPQHAR